MSEEAAKRTVLVAEDESLIRMDIVETLGDLGFEVVAEAAPPAAPPRVVRATSDKTELAIASAVC